MLKFADIRQARRKDVKHCKPNAYDCDYNNGREGLSFIIDRINRARHMKQKPRKLRIAFNVHYNSLRSVNL